MTRLLLVSALLALAACTGTTAESNDPKTDTTTDAGTTDTVDAGGGRLAARCDQVGDEASCKVRTFCHWYTPGCSGVALTAPVCRNVEECRADGDCADGLTCEQASVAPEKSEACAEVRALCLRPAENPCAGAHRGRGGAACVGPDDKALPFECCSPYDCNVAHLTCREMTPECPEGTKATLVDGCWGGCVPTDLCDNTQPVPAQLGDQCGPGSPAGASCATGMICPGAEEPNGAGVCELDQMYSCQGDQACPTGAHCCFVSDARGQRYMCFRDGAVCPDP